MCCVCVCLPYAPAQFGLHTRKIWEKNKTGILYKRESHWGKSQDLGAALDAPHPNSYSFFLIGALPGHVLVVGGPESILGFRRASTCTLSLQEGRLDLERAQFAISLGQRWILSLLLLSRLFFSLVRALSLSLHTLSVFIKRLPDCVRLGYYFRSAAFFFPCCSFRFEKKKKKQRFTFATQVPFFLDNFRGGVFSFFTINRNS